ncbi:MAG: carboxypeptidase-like regulatory domain-containing protein, partial [Fidelibacterota bacterium]
MIKILFSFLMIGFLFAADKFAVNGIVQSENGDGLKKVELTIFDTDGEEVKSTKSKKDGSFKFKKIEQGDYTLFG